MQDGSKNKFDAWTALRDHAWLEFEDKVRAEWRLSFGIWAALLAAAGAFLGNGTVKLSQLYEYAALAFLTILIVVHAYFLYWIQLRLHDTRGYLWEAQGEMKKTIGEQYAQGEFERSPWYIQPTLWVQIVITVLLAGVLWTVAIRGTLGQSGPSTKPDNSSVILHQQTLK